MRYIYLTGEWLPTVDSFKQVGSTLQAEGRCEKYVTNRIRSGRTGLREMSGVIWDTNEVLKNKGPGLQKLFEHLSVFNSQSVLRNDVTLYVLSRRV